MELQSIACPVEGLSLAGDQDTDLSNDIQPSQIVCIKRNFSIYNIELELADSIYWQLHLKHSGHDESHHY